MANLYLHKHNHTLPQNFADGRFVVIVALKNFFLQEFSCCEMKCLIGPVEPAAIQPLLPCEFKSFERTDRPRSILKRQSQGFLVEFILHYNAKHLKKQPFPHTLHLKTFLG